MNRFLLSLAFIFGLINFAYAENEKVLLSIRTEVLRCDSGYDNLFCAPGLEPGLPSHYDDVTFELIKDEKFSNETYEFYWAVWGKDFSEQGFTYSSRVKLFKRVRKHENAESEVEYSVMYETGFTQDTAGRAEVTYPDINKIGISGFSGGFAYLLGGDIVKEKRIYRPKLSLGVRTKEPTDIDKESTTK